MMEMRLMPVKGVLRIPGKDNSADYGSRSPKPDADGDMDVLRWRRKLTLGEKLRQRSSSPAMVAYPGAGKFERRTWTS